MQLCHIFFLTKFRTLSFSRSTVAGIYDLRRLQFKRCGRLGLKAVLALDCCLGHGTVRSVGT